MKRGLLLLTLAACSPPSLSITARPSTALMQAQSLLVAPQAEVTVFEGNSERGHGAQVLQQVFDLRDQTEPQHLRATLSAGEYHVRLVYFETRATTGTRLPIELARTDIIVFQGKPVTAELDPVTAPNLDPEIDLDADDDGLTNLDEIVGGSDPEASPILWEVSAGAEGVGRSDVIAGAEGVVVINTDANGKQISAASHALNNGQQRWFDDKEGSYKSDGAVLLMRGKGLVPSYRVVSAAGAPLWSHAFSGFSDTELFDSPYMDANNALVVLGTNGRLVGYRPSDDSETFGMLNGECTAVRKAERQLRYSGPLYWLISGGCGQGQSMPPRIAQLGQTNPLTIAWHVATSTDARFAVTSEGGLAVCDGDFLRGYSPSGAATFAHQFQRSGPTFCTVAVLKSGDIAVTTNIEARIVSAAGALKAQLALVQGGAPLSSPPIPAGLDNGGIAMAVPILGKASTMPQRIVALKPDGTSQTLYTIASSAIDNTSVIYSNVAVTGQTMAFVGFRCLSGAACTTRPPALIGVKF